MTKTDTPENHNTPAPEPEETAPPAAQLRVVVPPDPNAGSDVGADIHILAGLPTLDYERVRKQEAKRLGMRSAVLDKAVVQARGNEQGKVQGRSIKFHKPEPWPEPVDGAAMLESLRAVLHRYVIIGIYDAVASALWIVHTYMLAALGISPFLCARSPVFRCGKTRLLSFIAMLAHRALATSNITPAALFRVIEATQPTLMIDEFDTVATASDELRGILNSGHTRTTAFVVRLVGDDHEPRQFSTFGAKAFALIGDPPPTILDRSIVIDMRRKHSDERVAKLPGENDDEIKRLRSMLARFAEDHIEEICVANPTMPKLNDRALDNWSPLFSIADVAGDVWPKLARQAAVELSGGETEAEGVRVQLLEDLRELFADRRTDRLPSVAICEVLASREDRPWPEFGRNAKPITQRQLASLLKAFKVQTRTIRTEAGTSKGYYLDQFGDLFARYLSEAPSGVSDPSHRHSPEKTSPKVNSRSVTEDRLVTDRNLSKPPKTSDCDAVTAETPHCMEEDDFLPDDDPDPDIIEAEMRASSRRCPRCDGEGCRWCKREARQSC